MTNLSCRFCSSALQEIFADLGSTPLSNAYLKEENQPEVSYPLCAYVCNKCLLVQLPEFVEPKKIFEDYKYFSSYSSTWLRHSRAYARMITRALRLNTQSFVVEIASNDGYLLQYFQQANIPCLGVEPAKMLPRKPCDRG